MKALSVRQPYAWALIAGRKPVEYRTWRTDHRGPLAIHAARSRSYLADPADLAEFRREWPDLPDPDRLVYGAVIGIVNLVDCVPSPDRRGEWHWRVADPRPLETPVPCVGNTTLFRVELSTGLTPPAPPVPVEQPPLPFAENRAAPAGIPAVVDNRTHRLGDVLAALAAQSGPCGSADIAVAEASAEGLALMRPAFAALGLRILLGSAPPSAASAGEGSVPAQVRVSRGPLRGNAFLFRREGRPWAGVVGSGGLTAAALTAPDGSLSLIHRVLADGDPGVGAAAAEFAVRRLRSEPAVRALAELSEWFEARWAESGPDVR